MKPCCAACILPGLSSRFSGPPAYSALQCGYSTSPPFRTHTEVMSFDILPQILTQQKGNQAISPLHGIAHSAPWSVSRRLGTKHHLSHPHILALVLDSLRPFLFLRACISSQRHPRCRIHGHTVPCPNPWNRFLVSVHVLGQRHSRYVLAPLCSSFVRALRLLQRALRVPSPRSPGRPAAR